MTTRRKSGNSSVVPGNAKSAGNNTWRGFVNIDLSVAQKDAAIKLSTDVLSFWAMIEGTLMSGYRLGVSFNPRENIYTATVTGTSEHDSDEGIACSARASAPDRALCAVMVKLEGAAYKLADLFEGTTFRAVDL